MRAMMLIEPAHCLLAALATALAETFPTNPYQHRGCGSKCPGIGFYGKSTTRIRNLTVESLQTKIDELVFESLHLGRALACLLECGPKHKAAAGTGIRRSSVIRWFENETSRLVSEAFDLVEKRDALKRPAVRGKRHLRSTLRLRQSTRHA